MIGINLTERFPDVQIGDTMSFGGRDWNVVGHFSAGGSAFESEVWGENEQFMPVFRGQGDQSIVPLSEMDLLPPKPPRDPDTTPPRIDRLTPAPGRWVVDNIGLVDLEIGFDEAVTVPGGAVSAWALNGGEVTAFTTSYDSGEDVLTVTFDPRSALMC